MENRFLKHYYNESFDINDWWRLIQDKFHEVLIDLQKDYKKKAKEPYWKVVELPKVKKAWSDFVKFGFVRNEEVIEEFSQIFIDNILHLYVNTVLAGHSSGEPDEYFTDYNISEDEKEFFYDYIGDKISDYAMEPLMNLAVELQKAEKVEEKIVILDKILNVVHQRGDIAAMFIQGGSHSLNQLSDIHESVCDLYGGIKGSGGYKSYTEYETGASILAEAAHCILGSLNRAGDNKERQKVEMDHIREELDIIKNVLKEYSKPLYIEDNFKNSKYAKDSLKSLYEGSLNLLKDASSGKQKVGNDLGDNLAKSAYDVLINLANAMIKSVKDKTWRPIINAFEDKDLKLSVRELEYQYTKWLNELKFNIKESLDSKIKYTKKEYGKSAIEYHFELDENEFFVTFTEPPDDELMNFFEVGFSKFPTGRYDLNTYDITGDSKNPLQVFGIISNILKDWIKEYNSKGFFFSSKEPSRNRLYDRFAKMIEQKTNYKFDEELNKLVMDFRRDNKKYYTFIKR